MQLIGNLLHKSSPNSKYRSNPDSEVISHGNVLAEIGKSYKCFPLNNLTYKGKHFDGKFNFNKGKNKSQNDIVLANSKALDKITSFCIHEIRPTISPSSLPVRFQQKLINLLARRLQTSSRMMLIARTACKEN